tara:strand:- start:1909 stop:2382 length:474 start_codon:yes stop_codon:yes gene_type:complete
MSDKIKRTSRGADERAKKEAPKSWAPPSSLDAPKPPQGFVQRWIRVESMGFQDTSNVSRKLREGWEFVRAETLKEEIGENQYPIIAKGEYSGLIGTQGLVLARIPEEIAKSRAEYFAKISASQMQTIDNDLMKEQRPGMPINIDRQTRVTFGGGRKQ